MKTVLITGASGYVGKAFLAAFGRNYKFRVFGRTPVEGFEFFKGDIKSLEDLESATKGADAVLHLAAATTDGTGITDYEYFQTNTVGTFNLLEAAARNKVPKVVYGSSVCAVGFRATPRLVMETDKCSPSDGMYGYSKYLSEQLCECYASTRGIRIIALRTAMVVPQHKITAPANPLARHWLGAVHIEDVLQAFRLAIDNDGIAYGVYHVAADNPASKFDISKARSELGYRPAHDLKELTSPGAIKAARALLGAALSVPCRIIKTIATKRNGTR
ncbi:MAG: NAD(P)-dependent oxidoreductase [Deltaproteobacteria bacterium]|nr:NAD(P)-dependent oxidoreductase [Deltaproteobacteria bacterium]